MIWLFSYDVFLSLTWSYSCMHSVRWKFEKLLALICLIYLGKMLLKYKEVNYYNSPEYSHHSSHCRPTNLKLPFHKHLLYIYCQTLHAVRTLWINTNATPAGCSTRPVTLLLLHSGMSMQAPCWLNISVELYIYI